MRKLTLFLSIFILPGCASIMLGTTQDIGISSSPSRAKVTINGVPKGLTPVSIALKRKKKHMISLELSGYEPYEMVFTKSVSGWAWGNIIFGGLIGLVVDAESGGLYVLEPKNIRANLIKKSINVSVVLKPEKNWMKIGELTPLSKNEAQQN